MKGQEPVISMALLALFLGTGSIRAQGWGPVGPPPWTNTSITTVGGITYFSHASYPLAACHRVFSGPVSRTGTNISQTISEEAWSGICLECFDCYHAEQHASVLGSLPPGTYRFVVSFANVDTGSVIPFASAQFSVPSPAEPSLAAWLDASAANFTLSVAGISNATYVIQSSSLLTNWISTFTNSGAPFQWSEPVSNNNGNRFYRVLIRGT